MEAVSILLHVTLFLSTLLLYPFLRKQKKGVHMKRFKLPPGSMGWPYVGETLQLYSQDPNIFFLTKQKRYGEIFKTHILGCPCVMLASPEAAKFVLVTHANLFKPTYPKSKEKLIGPYALFFHEGEYHTRLRKLVQSSLAPDAIKKLIPDIERIAVTTLESWAASGQVINTFYEMKKFSFDVGILSIFGHFDRGYREKLEENYRKVDKGYNSFPTNIPGNAYHKAVLARKSLNQILGKIIYERKEKNVLEKDLLDHFLNFKNEKGQTLTEDQIADNIIGVLFAAQDTTASVITWILKFLHDDPKLLEAVKAEQNAIYESNNGGKRPLTWEHTRSEHGFFFLVSLLKLNSLVGKNSCFSSQRIRISEMGEGDLKEMVEAPPSFVEKKEKHDQKHGGMTNTEDDDFNIDDDVTTTSESSLGEEYSRTNSQGSTCSSSSDLVYDDASSSTSNSSNNCNGPLYELSELMAQLPIKRGLSKYFQGKSQSFTSIISSVKSIEELAKKESPYRKKMKACKSYGGGRGLETHKLYTLPRPTISKKVSRNSMSSLSFPASRSSFLSRRPPLFPVQKNF